MIEALKNKLAEKAKESANTVKNLLEDMNIKVSDDEQKKRFSICDSCNEFYKRTQFCKVCGCYMPAKTWIAASSCPLKKWIKIENITK